MAVLLESMVVVVTLSCGWVVVVVVETVDVTPGGIKVVVIVPLLVIVSFCTD